MKTLSVILACLALAACAGYTENSASLNGDKESVAVNYDTSDYEDAAEYLTNGD